MIREWILPLNFLFCWSRSLKNRPLKLTSIGVLGMCCAGCIEPAVIVVEQVEYLAPQSPASAAYADDPFELSLAPSFDSSRGNSERDDGSTVNHSAAVIKLDLSPLKPDVDQPLLKVHSSYRNALQGLSSQDAKVLASTDMIDAKARQFDEGLSAALEQYWYRGDTAEAAGDLDFFSRLASALPEDSRAAAYFAVGLELGGVHLAASNESAKSLFRERFESELTQLKPAGFYQWNDTLQQCFRVNRYFQLEFDLDSNDWMQPVIDVLKADPQLVAEYRQILERSNRLSGAATRLTVLDLMDFPGAVELVRLRRERRITSSAVSLLPPYSSRETALVRQLFPLGVSSVDDITAAIVKAVRLGGVNLPPGPQSGWTDYQAYALETLFVPERGDESPWLLQTGSFKRRRVQTFEAIMSRSKVTKLNRQESKHDLGNQETASQDRVAPLLRLEPAPTYYLRMARSYRFLNRIFNELVPEQIAASLHGLTQSGTRTLSLQQELIELQRLFYGCYLLSAEDLGMELSLDEAEQSELGLCRTTAETWLANFTTDVDLAVDARSIIPVADDTRRGVISAGATLGVRTVRFQASYLPDAAPRVRRNDSGDWTPLAPDQLQTTDYLLPVDDFAPVTISSSRLLTQAEFQKLCDDLSSRDKILARLQL